MNDFFNFLLDLSIHAEEQAIFNANFKSSSKSQLFGSPKFCTRNRLAEWSRILHCLNNQEFRNPVMVRYDWAISEMPSFYACRKKNSVDHALSIIIQERWLGSNPSSQGNQRCRSHHNERSRMHRCGDRAWSS